MTRSIRAQGRPWVRAHHCAALMLTHGVPKGCSIQAKRPLWQPPLRQPQAQAVVDEQLDAVAARVDEGVGAVRADAAEPVDDAREHAVKARAHVDGGVAQVQAVHLRAEDGSGCGCGLRNGRERG